MRVKTKNFAFSLATIAFAGASLSLAEAQTVADFYKGATISVIISTGAGGGNDSVARTVARHMAKYIPGKPTFVPKNMPGAGSIVAANYLYNTAPRDGTVIGTLAASVMLHQPLRNERAKFNAEKFFYLGSSGVNAVTMIAWHTAKVTKFEDLFHQELIVGGTGDGGSSTTYPMIMNNVLGTKFKIVSGYKSIPEVSLALIRGEIEGQVNSLQTIKAVHPEWLAERKVNILAQFGLERYRELPDVPLVLEFSKTDEQRAIIKLFSAIIAIGRPFLSTPEVPPDRAAILRSAFDSTMRDQEFLADSEKAKIDIETIPGALVTEIVSDLVSISPEIAQRAKALVPDL